MRPLDAVPSRALVREREALTATRGPIEGRVIAVDVGDGGTRIHRRAAQAIVLALQAVGADPRLLVLPRRSPRRPTGPARERCRAAASITVELTTGTTRQRRSSAVFR